MTENWSDSLLNRFDWNLDTADDHMYFVTGRNGLDCELNLEDSLYPFLANEQVLDEDSKFPKIPSEDADCDKCCPIQNFCDDWMNSNTKWLDDLSHDLAAGEKNHTNEYRDSLIDDMVDPNSPVDRTECHSIESDDNNSDDYSMTDNHSSLSSANKSDLDSGLGSKVGSDINFSDDALCLMKTKELNIQISGLSEAEKIEIKSRRRTLKNRGYAQNSRSKRTKLTNSLQVENQKLRSLIANLQSEKNKVAQERDDLKRKLQYLNKK